MERIDEIVSELRAYTPAKVEEDLLKIVEEHEPELVDLNIAQLMAGLDAKGNALRRYRSAAYAALKQQLNPRGVTDLKLTGAFHQSIKLNTGQWPVTTEATDEKTGELIASYGPDILDTPQQNKNEIAQEILGPDVKAYYEGQIFNI